MIACLTEPAATPAPPPPMVIDDFGTEALPGEIWRDVPDFKGSYQVSNRGRVRSLARKRVIHREGCRHHTKRIPARVLKANGRRYSHVAMYSADDNCVTRNVHVIVADAFIGARPPNHEVNHKDTNKRNNDASNLEYVTPKRNTAHAIEMGLRKQYGERHTRARRDAETIDHIHAIAAAEPSLHWLVIDQRLKLPRGTAAKILRGTAWRRVSLERGHTFQKRRMPERGLTLHNLVGAN